MSDKQFSGKSAIVTGATRGIGRAIALELARRGADIAFNYAKSAEAAESLKSEIEALGVRAVATQSDVANTESAADMVKQTKEAFGRIDFLINNAGITRDTLILRMKEEDWDAVLDTVDALARLGGIGPAEAATARRSAHLGNLARDSQDSAALTAYWKQLPSDMRNDPVMAAAAARYHLALGSAAPAQAIVEQALEREWNPALVALYGEAAGEDALPQIERAEKWLRAHARDPALLLALGKLCMRQGLWGKAQSYIEASIALEPTHDGHMTLAALMERIGKHQEAVLHFRKSAELAG